MEEIIKKLPHAFLGSFLFILASVCFIGCQEDSMQGRAPETPFDDSMYAQVKVDLDDIRARGKLVAITGYSSTSYFIYRGKPMGYEYELLSRFADHLGVDLEIVLAHDIEEMFDMLNRGEGDIIAYSLTVMKKRAKKVSFTTHHNEVRQVLIQRKPDNWRQMAYHNIEKALIRNPLDLEGKIIHVRKNSAYATRLRNLAEEIGGDISVVEAAGEVDTEELIELVADERYDYTVADENIALINRTYYSNLDVKTAISFPQKIAWAVRKNSPHFLRAVNGWIDQMRKQSDYYVIYNKYYKNRRAYIKRVGSDYYSVTGGKISAYDDLLKHHGGKLEWDWRLLAAQVYQESHFNPQAESWAGAVGLMQLIPATAERFGAEDLYDPRQSLEAGTNYLKWLNKFWIEKIPEPTERIKFVLASYNVGPGHVEDARRLAKKYGANPTLWEGHVAKYLRHKSDEKYYNDEVVKFGYCRGEEPYNYVKKIITTYKHYAKFIEAGEEAIRFDSYFTEIDQNVAIN